MLHTAAKEEKWSLYPTIRMASMSPHRFAALEPWDVLNVPALLQHYLSESLRRYSRPSSCAFHCGWAAQQEARLSTRHGYPFVGQAQLAAGITDPRISQSLSTSGKNIMSSTVPEHQVWYLIGLGLDGLGKPLHRVFFPVQHELIFQLAWRPYNYLITFTDQVNSESYA
jgi:hypothetical protein